MSNEPLLDIDRLGLAALRAQQLARAVERGDDVRHPQHEELLPFTEPLACKRCGGDLTVVQVTKERRGRVVIATTSETVLCPRCKVIVR